MKIRLHNKFEITLRNKTYTAYNTLLQSVYDKIANLEQYTSHIAIGTGTTHLNFTDTTLNNYLMTFKAETSEIQSDISKGTLFIKKVANIDENNSSTFSFSELGITNTSESNPTIFNHVVLEDENGDPISLTRNQGDSMQICVTIYLYLSQDSDCLFTSGKNYLIEQILGEDLSIENRNIYALRGENLLENKQIFRETPVLANLNECSCTITHNDDLTISICFFADLGEGETEEVLICFNNKACLRYNTRDLRTPLTETNTYTPDACNNIDLGNNIKEVLSVDKVSESGNTSETSYTTINYTKKLTDKLNNIFDEPFNSSTPRFVSNDGKRIAFIYNSYLHLYQNQDYTFSKINTSQFATNNVNNIFILNNFILAIKTTTPYIDLYQIENNMINKLNINMDSYNNLGYSYNWLDVKAIITDDNRIKIGVILSEDNKPLVITLTKSTDNIYYDSIQTPILTSAVAVYSLHKNTYNDSVIGFLTDTYAGDTNYLLEEFYQDTSGVRNSSDMPFTVLNETLGIKTGGRLLLSQKPTAPYLKAYYYPELTYADSNYSTGINHYLSKDGNYIVAKYSDNTYKIFNAHKFNVLEEFEKGFDEFVDQSKILDMEFVGDTLIIFTSINDEPNFGIALKNDATRIDKLTDVNSTYLISYKKYDIIGSKKLEGVKIELNFKFGGNSSII